MGIRKQLLALLFGVDVALIEKLERKLAKRQAKHKQGRKRRKKKNKHSKGRSESPLPTTTPEQEAARIQALADSDAIHQKSAPEEAP